MERGAWWATVHRVAKSWMRLSECTCTHTYNKVLKNLVAPTHPNERKPTSIKEDPVQPKINIFFKRLSLETKAGQVHAHQKKKASR